MLVKLDKGNYHFELFQTLEKLRLKDNNYKKISEHFSERPKW